MAPLLLLLRTSHDHDERQKNPCIARSGTRHYWYVAARLGAPSNMRSDTRQGCRNPRGSVFTISPNLRAHGVAAAFFPVTPRGRFLGDCAIRRTPDLVSWGLVTFSKGGATALRTREYVTFFPPTRLSSEPDRKQQPPREHDEMLRRVTPPQARTSDTADVLPPASHSLRPSHPVPDLRHSNYDRPRVSQETTYTADKDTETGPRLSASLQLSRRLSDPRTSTLERLIYRAICSHRRTAAQQESIGYGKARCAHSPERGMCPVAAHGVVASIGREYSPRRHFRVPVYPDPNAAGTERLELGPRPRVGRKTTAKVATRTTNEPGPVRNLASRRAGAVADALLLHRSPPPPA